jgi:tRNA-dihydrouridine synthase
VICNGDIMNYDQGMDRVQDLDGFMIGRGSFWNPWCFLSETHESTHGGMIDTANFHNGIYHPPLGDILDTMLFHAGELVNVKWERKWSLEIRKHLVQYLKNFPWVKEYRRELVTVESIEQSTAVIESIRTKYSDHLEKKPGLGELDEL